jgi:hypothetical protein
MENKIYVQLYTKCLNTGQIKENNTKKMPSKLKAFLNRYKILIVVNVNIGLIVYRIRINSQIVYSICNV